MHLLNITLGERPLLAAWLKRVARLNPPQLLLLLLLSAMLLGAVWPAGLVAQMERKDETAAGRVVFAVTDQAIVVAASAGDTAPGSRLPAIVPMGSYVGVLMGPIEWSSANSPSKPIRLDAELPQTIANATRRVAEAEFNQPTDIERIGIATLELLRPLVDNIHHRLDIAPDQPLIELLLADYAVDYGPEIWSLQYRVRQQSVGNDYWTTRVQRPAYHQLYPPERGRPRTLVEVQNPRTSQPGLLDRLTRHDPAFDPIRSASAEMIRAVSAILGGSVSKVPAGIMADFLRAALPVADGGTARLTMGLLDARRGFQWQLPPEQPLPLPAQTRPQEPGAPTLRQYTPPPQ